MSDNNDITIKLHVQGRELLTLLYWAGLGISTDTVDLAVNE